METKPSLISRFSLLFLRNHRVTILIALGLIMLGIVAYTTLLKREGFPAVNVPTVIIQTNYFVNDTVKVDSSITTQIEDAIKDIPEIKSVSSTTTENTSSIRAQFDDGFSTKEGKALIRDEVQQDVKFPDGASIQYLTFNAGAVDGTHDLVFAISADKPIKEVQEKAGEVAAEVEKLDVVQEAKSLDLITTRVNPQTGKPFEYQASFNRVGVKDNGQLQFRDAVSIGIIRKGEVGTLDLSKAVREKVDQLIDEGTLKDYSVSYGGDLATSLTAQIKSLEENAISAIILIIIVLALLINWRASVVLAIFLPLSLGAVFLSLYVIGYSLNTISLFALILVLGLFVDDGTIVVEAIDYHKRQGKKGVETVVAAINDIGIADISGTLTTLLVFVPMLFISGILGDFIELIPVTVILAMSLSLVIALSIIPYLTNLAIRDSQDTSKRNPLINQIGAIMPNAITMVATKLANFSAWYLKRPVGIFSMIAISIGLVLFGTSFASKLPFSVFPSAKDTEALTVQLSYPEGLSLEEATSQAKQVEQAVKDTIGEEVEQVTYYRGNVFSAFVRVDLRPMKERTPTANELVDRVIEKLPDLGDTNVKVDQVSAGPTAEEYPFAMQVYSNDQTKLEAATAAIRGFLINRDLGDGEKITDVRIDNLSVIAKRNGDRYAEVRAKIRKPENTGKVLAIQELVKGEFTETKLDTLGLSKDALSFDLGQESENLESFQSAVVAFAAALLIMYGLLVMQFNSFSQPLLVFLAIPFAFPGLFPGLYATNNALSFFVMVGAIALAGIVVNNTIMLLEFANHARKEGKTAKEAIAQAIRIRFRPMLTTTVVTIGGLVPLAISDPFWESLALTIIFGLTSSLLIVFFAFPAYYVTLESIRSYRPTWYRAKG